MVEELFEKADETGEYIKFDRIPESERMHRRPDLCAFLYLEKVLGGGNGDIVSAAEHDEIYLDYEGKILDKLTEADVVYLTRCGVRYIEEYDCLGMFV